nr:glycosyltransferase family 1 protein [Deinococcus sp. RM]
MPPENVKVIYNPVGIPQIDNKESSHMVKLIGLGRIGKRKGVYDLIDAVALIKEEVRKSIKIVWHGDGEIREANEYALSRGVEHHFDFKSWIGDTEKKNLLKSADIFVLPSYDEGLPMALLEAMSYSIPVITTNVGGIPEVISSGTEGILLTPGDIISLKVAIEDLAKNRDLRQSMGENGRRASEQLDITSYMLRIRNIYSEITI